MDSPKSPIPFGGIEAQDPNKKYEVQKGGEDITYAERSKRIDKVIQRGITLSVVVCFTVTIICCAIYSLIYKDSSLLDHMVTLIFGSFTGVVGYYFGSEHK